MSGRTFALLTAILYVLSGKVAEAQNQLPGFINAAFQNSPLIKINDIQAQANLLEAQRNIATLQKTLIGSEVNYMLSPVYSSDNDNAGFRVNPAKSITDYYGYDLSATNGGIYRGIITLDQPLFNKQRIVAVSEQANVQNQILENNAHLTKHQLERMVTEQYILCIQDLQQQLAVEEIARLIETQIKITERLSANGLAKQSDYKLLQIEWNRQQSTLQSLKDNYKINLLNLYAICGIEDTTTVELSPLKISLQQEEPKTSGFTAQYLLDSISLATNQKLFNLRYKPTVGVYSSAGLNGVYAPDLYKRFGWEAGIRVTKILFDGNQKKINDSRTKILQQATAINTDFFVRQNETQKNSLLASIASIDRQTQSLKQQVKEYDSLTQYYSAQMAAGQSSIIEYLTVLRSEATLKTELVALETKRLIAVNNFNYLNW